MFSAGVVALQQGMLKGCSVAYGIPLKASGKNIFWDMKFVRALTTIFLWICLSLAGYRTRAL